MRSTDEKTTAVIPAGIMSMSDLANWGIPIVAYVRHKGAMGEGSWAIHAADGTQIGEAPDRATAFAAVRQHDLEPLSVH